MKYIDLTHTFTPDMPVFLGDPEPSLEQIAHIEKDSYNDHRLTTIMHVGTHMDAPLHMVENGKRIDELDIENFIGPGLLIDVRGKLVIDSSVIDGVNIPAGSVVLLYTGFGSKYRTSDYFEDYPEVKADFAKRMVEAKVKVVGMDTLGPDHDQPWPTHKILLGSEITIIENLTNLDKLLGVANFKVIALPAKLQADAAMVRVIAEIQS